MPMCTRGDVPSAAAAARLLHYCCCCSCRPMRTRRPRKSRSTATRDPSRVAHRSHVSRSTRGRYRPPCIAPTREVVRVQLPYSRAAWGVTVTPPWRSVGRRRARVRARALAAQVRRVPRRLSGIDRCRRRPHTTLFADQHRSGGIG